MVLFSSMLLMMISIETYDSCGQGSLLLHGSGPPHCNLLIATYSAVLRIADFQCGVARLARLVDYGVLDGSLKKTHF